jgi:hypothetical protein
MRTLRKYLPFIGLLLVIGLVFLASRVPANQTPMSHDMTMASESQLPSFLVGASSTTREAYRFAIANHHELEKYPCTCGCKYMAHMSNADCYVKTMASDGTVTLFDEHASACGICVDITLDVMRMMDDGYKPIDIRAYIDKTYSKYGPSTDTPLPLA